MNKQTSSNEPYHSSLHRISGCYFIMYNMLKYIVVRNGTEIVIFFKFNNSKKQQPKHGIFEIGLNT